MDRSEIILKIDELEELINENEILVSGEDPRYLQAAYRGLPLPNPQKYAEERTIYQSEITNLKKELLNYDIREGSSFMSLFIILLIAVSLWQWHSIKSRKAVNDA